MSEAVTGVVIDPTKPQFNFDELAWGDIEDSIIVANELQAAIDAKDSARIKAAMDGIRAFMARVVVSVPANWFVSKAPVGLTLDDPATYRYLRQARFKELQELMGKGMNPLSVTGT